MFNKKEQEKLIPVLPENYRRIYLKAIEIAGDPHVYMDNKEIDDYSEQGKLTQKGIRSCINFEIKDGKIGIIGFYDHPNEMWISEKYVQFVKQCGSNGWLKIEDPAS